MQKATSFNHSSLSPSDGNYSSSSHEWMLCSRLLIPVNEAADDLLHLIISMINATSLSLNGNGHLNKAEI
jgi:hypothetical protein